MNNRYALENNKAIWSDKLREEGWTLVRYTYHMTDRELEDMAIELVEWAKSTDQIKASMFPIHYKVSLQVFHEWCLRCPKLKDAYETAKHIIGERRERLALEGKYNAGIVLTTMPLYDTEFAAYRKEQASLAKKDGEQKQTILVVRERMPETQEVVPRRAEGTE